VIYTIGLRLKYERVFSSGGPVIKRGRGVDPDGRDYPGGFVFQAPDDARRFLASKGLTATHLILGVNADWESDTEMVAGEAYRRLIRDAELAKL
jgi:hypothetical protein